MIIHPRSLVPWQPAIVAFVSLMQHMKLCFDNYYIIILSLTFVFVMHTVATLPFLFVDVNYIWLYFCILFSSRVPSRGYVAAPLMLLDVTVLLQMGGDGSGCVLWAVLGLWCSAALWTLYPSGFTAGFTSPRRLQYPQCPKRGAVDLDHFVWLKLRQLVFDFNWLLYTHIGANL